MKKDNLKSVLENLAKMSLRDHQKYAQNFDKVLNKVLAISYTPGATIGKKYLKACELAMSELTIPEERVLFVFLSGMVAGKEGYLAEAAKIVNRGKPIKQSEIN